MECEVYVKAHHGDYSGVDTLRITTDERLSKSNLPDLKAAGKDLDRRCTESWANISMTGDLNDWEEEEIGCEECDYEGCEKCEEKEEEKGIEVSFSSDYGSSSSEYASYYAIEQELLSVLKLGKYVKTDTYDGAGGCKTEYVYYLSTGIFK